MYREGPPPPDPHASAKQSVNTASGLQIGMAISSAVQFLLVLFQLTVGMRIPPQARSALREVGTWALVLGIAWVLLGAGWGLLNARGLKQHRRWARYSSIAFGLFSLPSCCTTAFGVFLLFLMFKPEVKTFFASDDAR